MVRRILSDSPQNGSARKQLILMTDRREQPCVVEHLTRRSVLAGAGSVGLAGCLGSGDSPDATTHDGSNQTETTEDGAGTDTDDTANTEHTPTDDEEDSTWEVEGSPLEASFDVTVAVENLEIPWDIEFAPGGDVFITERPGRIRRLDIDALTSDTPIDESELPEEPVTLPDLSARGEGGILGITLHPAYPDPSFVYVFYTAEDDQKVDRVVRYDAADVDEVETIVDDLPGARYHNGGRIAFGPDEQLWISRGDVVDPDASQDPSSLVGAVLRVTADGKPAGSDEAPADADPRVFTYGHRNVQGIDWLPDGTPITTEHGPTARDEVNLLSPGHNYGWPVARGGPDDPEYEAYDGDGPFSPPVASSGTDETWAPSGGTWYDDEAIPQLENRFLFGGLRSQRVHVITLLDPGSQPPPDASGVYSAAWFDDRYLAVRHELLVEEFGRIRHVSSGPDGRLYFLTSNGDDVIGRLDPV